MGHSDGIETGRGCAAEGLPLDPGSTENFTSRDSMGMEATNMGI